MKPNKEAKLSRAHAPVNLSPADWQRGLRRQFGREQSFVLENLGDHPFFSEFRVTNPNSKSSYDVAVRGLGPGGNLCSCPDYATNELGTCKHLEFTLAQLETKRGAKAAFARGYQPAFSELYLRNAGDRRLHFRAGTDCPPPVRLAADRLFDMKRDGLLPDEQLGELKHFMAIRWAHSSLALSRPRPAPARSHILGSSVIRTPARRILSFRCRHRRWRDNWPMCSQQ